MFINKRKKVHNHIFLLHNYLEQMSNITAILNIESGTTVSDDHFQNVFFHTNWNALSTHKYEENLRLSLANL